MPTAAPQKRRTTDEYGEVVSDNPPPKWDLERDYLVTAPNPEYKGKSGHLEFNMGKAQMLGLSADASDAEMEQRIFDLDWLANAGYLIQRARFLRVEEEVLDDDA